MDVAEFYQWVRETLNRGSKLDSVIPHYIRASVREIENKRDFQHLEWWAQFTIQKNAKPIIALPTELKHVDFIRWNSANAGEEPKWNYLSKADPEKTVHRIGDPKLYWMASRELAVLDAKLDKTRDFEIFAYRYSNFPDEADGKKVSHWLIDAMPLGLHAKVMLGMSGFIREDDPKMMQNWGNLYSEAVNDLIMEHDMAREENKTAEMIFWPDHIPYDMAFEDREDG